MKNRVSFLQRIAIHIGNSVANSIAEDIAKKMDSQLNDGESLYVLPLPMLTSMGLDTTEYVYIGCMKNQVLVNKDGMKIIGELTGKPVYAFKIKVNDYTKKTDTSNEEQKPKEESETPKAKSK